MDINNEHKQIYDECCKYYKYVEEISTNYDITVEEIEDIFDTLLCENMMYMYQDIKEIIDGIKFYKEIFEKQKKITSRDDLVDVIKFEFIDNGKSEHIKSKYNIVGYCMKITTHYMWRICYEHSLRLHTTPEGAINDILDPTKASQKEIQKIYEYLKNKYSYDDKI